MTGRAPASGFRPLASAATLRQAGIAHSPSQRASHHAADVTTPIRRQSNTPGRSFECHPTHPPNRRPDLPRSWLPSRRLARPARLMAPAGQANRTHRYRCTGQPGWMPKSRLILPTPASCYCHLSAAPISFSHLIADMCHEYPSSAVTHLRRRLSRPGTCWLGAGLPAPTLASGSV